MKEAPVAKPVESPKPTIAVLYLQNLSPEKEDEYFAAGITEDIITQFNQPLIKEFESLLNESYIRLRIGLVHVLKGEPGKAREQVEKVRSSLEASLLIVEYVLKQDIVLFLSFVYFLNENKEEAVRLLDFLVKIKVIVKHLTPIILV